MVALIGQHSVSAAALNMGKECIRQCLRLTNASRQDGNDNQEMFHNH